MNKLAQVTMIAVCLSAAVPLFARDYGLNSREAIDLSGVDSVVIDLNGISCALCFRTVDVRASVQGEGTGADMTLSLTGSVNSNRSRAVPDLIVDRDRSTVRVRLYPRQRTFVGLSQRGSADFSASIPSSFRGSILIKGSSDEISVRDLALRAVSIESSSGGLVVEDIRADDVRIDVSSGDLNGGPIEASDRLRIASSSGDIALSLISAGSAEIESSSGGVSIRDAHVEHELALQSSSGNIEVGAARATELRVDSSSGGVRFAGIQADHVRIDLSSGNIEIGSHDALETEIDTSAGVRIDLARGAFVVDGSSGTIEIGFAELDRNVEIEQSSGTVTLLIPRSSGFDAKLETSSGRISTDFAVAGDLDGERGEIAGTVNGGGPDVTISVSSGDVVIRQR